MTAPTAIPTTIPATIPLAYRNRVFRVAPTLDLALEIEEELGALPVLARAIEAGNWRVGDIVTLVQMMLQSAGHTADYRELGAALLQEGIGASVSAAQKLLAALIAGEREAA